MLRKLEIDSDLKYYNDTWAFSNNFNILRYRGYRECSISLYIDDGNLSSEYAVEQDCMIENSRENRVKIQRAMTKEGCQRVSQVVGTLEELRDDIGGVNYENIEELRSQLDELGITHTSNYLRMSTRGYSQGDYGEILVNVKEMKDEIGSNFVENQYQKWFDHYFWDSPIGGTISIEFEYTRNSVNIEIADEIDFREFTNDEYDIDGLDIDGIIRCLKIPYSLTPDEVVELKNALGKIDYTDVTYPCSC